MKLALVCAILSFAWLTAQESSAPSSQNVNVNVQHLFKFSGTLMPSQRSGTAGSVALRFAIYDQPFGGKAAWEETISDVHVDAQGHYTVLVGETAPVGLPPDIYASGRAHWLEVQLPGKSGTQRIPLVESEAQRKPEPVRTNSNNTSYNATDRRLLRIVLIMFLAGAALTYAEILKWWRTRTELYRRPPIGNPLVSMTDHDALSRAAQALRDAVSGKLETIRGRRNSAQTDDDRKNDQSEKVA